MSFDQIKMTFDQNKMTFDQTNVTFDQNKMTFDQTKMTFDVTLSDKGGHWSDIRAPKEFFFVWSALEIIYDKSSRAKCHNIEIGLQKLMLF